MDRRQVGLWAAGIAAGLAMTSVGVQAIPVLVREDGDAPVLRRAGAPTLARYDGFAVVEWDDSKTSQPPVGQAMPEWTRINLNAVTIYTDSADARKARTQFEAQPADGLFLVQLAGPPMPEWREALEKSGARIVDYIPSNTYLVYGPAASVTAVSRMDASQAPIRWLGAMRGEWKISPLVGHPGRTGKAALGVINTHRLGIQLVEDKVANEGTLNLIQAGARGPIQSDQTLDGQRTIVVELDPALVEPISRQPDVISIHAMPMPKLLDERQVRIVTGQVAPAGQPAAPGHMAWLAANGFTQASMDATNIIVDVTDSGIDNGTLSPDHFALRTGGTIAGTSRVAYNQLFGTPNSGSTLAGCDGHGNINAHIIAGFTNAAANTSTHRDASGYQYGLGVNPFVRVGSSVIFDPDTYTNPNFTTLASTIYNRGARISNNSWGADTGGAYTSDSRAYDLLTRDAQPTGAVFSAAGNQQMLFLFANGNDGPAARTVGSPATAKNVISVGAQENPHPFGGADACSVSDTGADNFNDTANFSSRGPTTDGRIKPDITAPGTHVTGGNILSSLQDGSNPAITGTANACFVAEGVCAGPSGNRHFPVGQQFYTASSGTSHSTPGVAGAASLVYDWYRRTTGAAPSPAMQKALLVNGARWLNGLSTGDNLPSNVQGMGMVDVAQTIAAGNRILRDQVPADTFTASLQSRFFTGRVTDGSKPLRITLAYTDAAGSTAGDSFVNNLTLEVYANGKRYNGNVFSGANSVEGGSPDLRNNLQSVFLPAGTFPSGTPISIGVRARTIAGDGVPNSGTATDQDFALVAYNVTQQDMMFPVFSATVNDSLGTGNNNGIIEPGESGVRLAATIENVGSLTIPQSVLRLVSETTGVRVIQGFSALPALSPGGAAAITATPFEIVVDSSVPCNSTIRLRLDLVNLSGALVASIPFERVLGGEQALSGIALNNLSLPISSGDPSTFDVPIVVSSTNVASRVQARVRLTHTWVGDLRLRLIHPDGSSAILINQRGGSGDNITNAVFSDLADRPISSGTPPFTGTFRPEEPLSVFANKPINGTWRLEVADLVSADGGVFQDIELSFFTSGCSPAAADGVFQRISLTDVTATGPFRINLGEDDATLASRNLGARVRQPQYDILGLTVNAVPPGGPNRIFGFLESDSADMPYSAVGTNRFVRARYAVAYIGPGDSASPTLSNLVPNFRIRAGMRFVDTAILEVLHNVGNTDPASRDLAREFGPATDISAPSIYKVDYDPIDAPQIVGDPNQGIQRGFETFAAAPDYHYVNGTLLITDSSIGTYPRPNLASAALKTYATGGTAGNSDFDNPAVQVFSGGVRRADAIAGTITSIDTPEPGMVGTRSINGITVNTTAMPNDRIGIIAVDFLEGTNADRTSNAGRVRVAADEIYVVTYRLRSSGNSNQHPYLRLRARTAKFQWAASLNIGGAKAVGSTEGQNFAAQILPGVGNQIPGTAPTEAVYNLILPTPLDLAIRRDRTGTIAQRFPVLSAQPGPGSPNPSLRDLKVGFDIVDNLSFAPGFETEQAVNTILDRIEIRKFPAPRD